MKKWFCALGMMLALLMSVALADGVKVTFAEKNGQINGGYDYTLKLNVSPASDKDLTVSLTCDGLDGAYSVVIPAGQKSTMLTVPTQVVEERGKVVFELQSGDGYTGTGQAHADHPAPAERAVLSGHQLWHGGQEDECPHDGDEFIHHRQGQQHLPAAR